MIELALYQPDIAQNTATILRMAACFGLRVHIIEPAGFNWSEASFRRAGMDYLDAVDVERQASWAAFREDVSEKRVILVTTKGDAVYTHHTFIADDVLLFGRESAGVPDHVHEAADARVTIPMREGMRSLNVAMATAMVTGEALRQLGRI